MLRGMARILNLANLPQFTAINVLNDPGFDPDIKPIPLCMEVRLNFLLDSGKTGHNVMHVRYSTGFPGSVTLANSYFSSIASALNTSGLLALLHTTTVFTGVSLRDKAVLHAPYIDSNLGTTPGQATGTALPNEVAAVLTERTAIVGPGGRGRIYITGFNTAQSITGNVMAGALVTALTTYATSLRNAMNAQGQTMCLALPSRVAYTGSTGTNHPPRLAQTVDVTNIVLRDNHWDSQRRRGLK